MKVVHICMTLEGGAGLFAQCIIRSTKSLCIDLRALAARGNRQDNVLKFRK